ncbi:MAG TPA: hypothetical protein VH599_19425 [Ktedonobacterales bacterium]|jgi:hypothetical protein
MSKRSRHPDPADPTQWVGQPYTPHDPYYYLTGQGRLRSPWKSLGFYGGMLLVGGAITCVALIVIGLIQTNGPAFWALLALIGAAIIGTLAGAASARHRRQSRDQQKRPRHHKAR